MSIQFMEISSAGSLRLSKELIIFNKKEDNSIKRIPLIDLKQIFIFSKSISVSTAVLMKCSENNVLVTFCDKRGYPTSTLTPRISNNLHYKYLEAQVQCCASKKANIWKDIVKSKISNQSNLLNNLKIDSSLISKYSNKVSPGDPSNIEALVAKRYWHQLFGEDFRRKIDLPGINAALNYGYAVIRSFLIRALLLSGLSSSIGVFHSGNRNAHPLADDLIEPLRPFVDSQVYRLSANSKIQKSLSMSVRQELAGVLLKNTLFKSLEKTLFKVLLEYCLSFRMLLMEECDYFTYPIMPFPNDPC